MEKPELLDERGFHRVLRRATVALSLALSLPTLALLSLVLILLHAGERVNHTDEVIAQANVLNQLLVEMQTSFRGYRLSNDESYLKLFAQDRSSFIPAANGLSMLVADNPPQLAQVARFRDEANAWFAFVDDELAKVRGNEALVHNPEFLKRGVPIFNTAQTRMDQIVIEERRLRALRDKNLDGVVNALLWTLGLVALAGIPALAFGLRRLLLRVSASYQASVDAAELRARELRVTLSSIGDAVVATDAEGKVTFLNPAAEGLMGWSNAEATGRPLSEVFDIFNQTTRVPVENPVARVLRKNVVVGLANHTVLRARDGREVPIEDSAAPIRSDRGEVLGVILVFHDVTERREIERKLHEGALLSTLRADVAGQFDLGSPLDKTLQGCCEILVRHLDVAFARIWTLDAEGETLILKASAGLYTHLDGPHARVPVGKFKIGRIAQNRQPHLTNDVAHDPNISDPEWARREGMVAFAGYPLLVEGRLAGVLAVFARHTLSDAVLGDLAPISDAIAQHIERKRAEAALHANEVLKTAVLDTSLDGFILMNHEGRIQDWNAAAERIFGATRAEVAGEFLSETIVPENLREAHQRGLARYLATREGQILGRRLELPALRADGKEFPCELSITHIPGTEPPLFAGYVRDITDRKENEMALRAATEQAEAAARAVAESADRFRLLSEVVSLQVWTARPDGELDFTNTECRAYFGVVADEEILGNGWTQFVHPDDLPTVAEMWQKCLPTGDSYEVEFRLRDRDGVYRWFLGRAEAMRDGDGRIAKWFGTNTDIHDLKMAQGEAERASRAKDDFLAVLSHELRTPLTPVLLTAAALREDDRLPLDVREQLGMMERNIGLEARLIDDLLDLTRIAKGKLPLRQQLCDTHSLIGLAIEIVRDEAQTKGIFLDRRFDAQHSGLFVDPSRLQQVMWNLLRNAVKFTPRGGRVTIRTRDLQREDGAEWLSIEVRDSGIGIEPDALERIFQPFEQAQLTGDHRFGGIGLGLAIARAIVDLHGGTIRAESEGADRGSVFIVTLPGATTPPAGIELPDTADLFLHGIAPAEPAPAMPSLRLMLVEDHEATLQVLTRLLTRAGHQVFTSNSVAGALAVAATKKIDLVISDLGLPDGTGNDLMEQLRDRHQLSGIALTGYGMEEDLERSRQAGFFTHLIKPVDFNQLRRAVAAFRVDRE